MHLHMPISIPLISHCTNAESFSPLEIYLYFLDQFKQDFFYRGPTRVQGSRGHHRFVEPAIVDPVQFSR